MGELLLRVVRGVSEGRAINVSGELVIGREADGDGRLDGEPGLSRRHARITRNAAGALTVEDLGSLNGTKVNGQRITAPRPLRAGDTLELGGTVLVVADASSAARPPSASPRRGASETVLTDGPVRVPRRRPAPRAGAGAGGGGGAGRAFPELPAWLDARIALSALAVVVAIGAWLLLSGGDQDPADIAEEGRRYTVQLIVRPSAVVQRLARAAPATAAPRTGSGIVVDRDRGLVLTADRLVAGSPAISGRFGTGRARGATLVSRAPCDGLALVRVPGLPGGARAAQTAAAGGLGKGDSVLALGYPATKVGDGELRGGRLRAVVGKIVAGPGPATPGPAEPRLKSVFVHDARVGVGGSGGPLVGDDGRVVAVGMTPTGGRRSVAVTSDRIRALYSKLATARTSADAGWRLEPWSQIRGRRSPGLLVTGVDPGGPADRASRGLLGATIFRVAGRRVSTMRDVCAALAGRGRGSRIGVEADVSTATLAGGRRIRLPSRGRAVRVRMRL